MVRLSFFAQFGPLTSESRFPPRGRLRSFRCGPAQRKMEERKKERQREKRRNETPRGDCEGDHSANFFREFYFPQTRSNTILPSPQPARRRRRVGRIWWGAFHEAAQISFQAPMPGVCPRGDVPSSGTTCSPAGRRRVLPRR